MALTLTTTTEIIRRAGIGANAVVVASSALLTTIGEEAEGELIADTRRDWVTGYANVNTFVKLKLSNATAAKAAFKIASYDRTGYFSNSEYLTLLNVLFDEYNSAVKVLSTLDSNNIRGVTD